MYWAVKTLNVNNSFMTRSIFPTRLYQNSIFGKSYFKTQKFIICPHLMYTDIFVRRDMNKITSPKTKLTTSQQWVEFLSKKTFPIKDHSSITSSKSWWRRGQKMAIFGDLQYCKSWNRWLDEPKKSKTWWRNTWMVPKKTEL